MKGFYIEITNNLLEPKHRKAIKESIWLFMWLLDKMTSISEEGIGKILGGKPITYEEVNKDLAISRPTYIRWIEILKKGNYINTVRAPNGLIITVNKAKKRFGRDVPKMIHHKIESDVSNSDSDVSKMDSDVSNSDIQYKTITKTIQRQNNITKVIQKSVPSYGNEDINYLLEKFKELTGLQKLDGSEKINRRYCWLCLKKFRNKENIEKLIKIALKDKFHQANLTSFKYLYYNGVKIFNQLKVELENPRLLDLTKLK